MNHVCSLILTLLLAGCSVSSMQEESLRLYVMDCGYIGLHDVSAFGLTNEEAAVRELFVPCYLVDHPEGQLLWDAGLDPAIVGKGEVPYGEEGYLRYDMSVIDQLGEIGFAPEDIDRIALSHMHFDHAGATNYFPNAELLIQDAEYIAAFEQYENFPIFSHDDYRELADNPRQVLRGDHDVFGDGRVMILSAPGHTPGHQVLALDLEGTGPIVLSGDLYHFRFSRDHRRVPEFNTDREMTLQSMEKIEAYLEATGAVLWIEHDMALAETLKKAPAYYD